MLSRSKNEVEGPEKYNENIYYPCDIDLSASPHLNKTTLQGWLQDFIMNILK